MDKLKFIAEQLAAIGIPFEFMEWTQTVQYPYFVGEFTEREPTTEDGAEFSTLILTGWHRGEYIELLNLADKIKKHFGVNHGLRARTENGSIAVFYGYAFFVPTGEAALKRIEIYLTIKEWKGDA